MRPLGLVGATLILDLLDGTSLSDVLRSGPAEFRCAQTEKAGRCLALLHNAGAVGPGPVDLDDRYRSLMNHCGDDGQRLPVMRTALSHLLRELPRFSGRRLELVRLHADAKPDNFLLADERVIALDVDWSHRNVGEMDVAQFLVQMMITLATLSGKVDHKLNADLEHAFIYAYEESRDLDAELLAWLRMYFLVSFWRTRRAAGILSRMRFHRMFELRLRNHLYNPPDKS